MHETQKSKAAVAAALGMVFKSAQIIRYCCLNIKAG